MVRKSPKKPKTPGRSAGAGASPPSGSPAPRPESPESPAAAPKDPAPEGDDFVVDRIVSHRVKDGVLQFRVFWQADAEGFVDKTWEPVENLAGNDVFNLYMAKEMSKPKTEVKKEPPSAPAPEPGRKQPGSSPDDAIDVEAAAEEAKLDDLARLLAGQGPLQISPAVAASEGAVRPVQALLKGPAPELLESLRRRLNGGDQGTSKEELADILAGNPLLAPPPVGRDGPSSDGDAQASRAAAVRRQFCNVLSLRKMGYEREEAGDYLQDLSSDDEEDGALSSYKRLKLKEMRQKNVNLPEVKSYSEFSRRLVRRTAYVVSEFPELRSPLSQHAHNMLLVTDAYGIKFALTYQKQVVEAVRAAKSLVLVVIHAMAISSAQLIHSARDARKSKGKGGQ